MEIVLSSYETKCVCSYLGSQVLRAAAESSGDGVQHGGHIRAVLYSLNM